MSILVRYLQQTACDDYDGQAFSTSRDIKSAAVGGLAEISYDLLERHLVGGLTIDGDDVVTRLERCL
jgi:hypothetical protein